MPPSRAPAASPVPPPVPPQVGQRGVELGGVLPDVQPDRAEAERLDLAAHRTDQGGGQLGPSALDQLVLHQPEVGEQRVGRRVAGRDRAGCRRARCARSSRWMRRSMQARYWRNTSPGLRLAISSACPVAAELALERRAEAVGDRDGLLGDAERADQLVEPAPVAAQPRQPVLEQRAVGDVVGDERIAVPVAADPRAELEERRHDPALARDRTAPAPARPSPAGRAPPRTGSR